MKTTLEIPDDLMRRIKIRAIHEHKKLKEEVAELLERGMEQSQRGEFFPKPIKLRGGIRPTFEEIRSAIEEGRK